MGRNPATGEAIKIKAKQEGRISCGQGTEARGIAAGLRSYRRPPRSVGPAAALFGWLIKPHGIFAVFTTAFDQTHNLEQLPVDFTHSLHA
jgi:hypothetical protein